MFCWVLYTHFHCHMPYGPPKVVVGLCLTFLMTVCSHKLSCIFRHFYDTYVSLYNFVTWYIVYLFIIRTNEIPEAHETMFLITISLLHWNKLEINVYLFLFSNNHEKRTTSWSQCLLYGFIKSINPRRLLVYYNHTTAHVLCREMVLNGTSSKEHKPTVEEQTFVERERRTNVYNVMFNAGLAKLMIMCHCNMFVKW